MSRCLYCYEDMEDAASMPYEFHLKCCRRFFGTETPPVLEYTQADMLVLAQKIIGSQRTVTGVQPKLSLSRQRMTGDPKGERFTIVGLWGSYILKPQTELYTTLPEIEDLTMHLAESIKIRAVPHSLIRLASGELAYITKRVDRDPKRKYHLEDMCQLTERQTEHKYKGSHEQIAKVINAHATNPGLDKVNFFELVLFCFLTGNNDMHLKNFSLLKNALGEYHLCPAYDLVATALLIEEDDEELALNLNGKKKKIKRKDFEAAMSTSGIPAKAIENIFKKFEGVQDKWYPIIENSFLTKDLKERYKEMIAQKLRVLKF